MSDELREQLADIQHAIWAHWMKYLFRVSHRNYDGSVTIPLDKVERWKRQMTTAYTELSDSEQDSYRKQADKVLFAIVQPVLADELAAKLAAAYQENDALVAQHNEMDDALAAATARAEAAEHEAAALRASTEAAAVRYLRSEVDQLRDALAAAAARAEAAEATIELRQKEGQEAAAEIDKLRATLAAERARAEAAERERDELRVALVGGCEDRDTDEGEYYEHGMVG